MRDLRPYFPSGVLSICRAFVVREDLTYLQKRQILRGGLASFGRFFARPVRRFAGDIEPGEIRNFLFENGKSIIQLGERFS